MTKRCIIIGAGASYGYNSKLIDSERPPLGRDVLFRAKEKGILTKEKFSHMFSTLLDYCDKNQKDKSDFSDVDIEEYLEYMALELEHINSTLNESITQPSPEEIEKITRIIQGDFKGLWKTISESYKKEDDPHYKIRAVANGFQSALGESWFLMFELFRYYSIAYSPMFDAYRRLALHHLDEEYDLISLNYDIIFELAANVSGIVVAYPDISPDKFLMTSSRIIRMAKVHGSINWFNSLGRAIALSGVNDSSYGLLNKIAGFIYSNRFHVGSPLIVDPNRLGQITMFNLLQSGTDYYEPALLPPVGGYKDYEKVQYFVRNWNEAEKMVSGADELVFIGTQVRKQDTKLRELLKEKAKNNIDITVVGSKPTDQDLRDLMGNKSEKTPKRYPDFEHFVQTF